MDNTTFCYSGISHTHSNYIDSLALNPKYHSLASFLKKLQTSDPQLRINEKQVTTLESLLKSVNESMSSLNDSNFSVSYDAFIKFYKKINLSHNLLHRYYKESATKAKDELKKIQDELVPLIEKSSEFDQLRSQVNELKSKLDSSQKQIIQDITKQLNLAAKPNDTKSLVRSIRQVIQKSQIQIKQIISEFDLPKSTTKTNLIQVLKNKVNEQIQQDQDEIEELNSQIEDLKASVISESDFSADQDKKSLQKTILKQKKRIHQLEKDLQDPNHGKDEIESLLKLYDDLSNQYRKQSDEILDAINARSSLIIAIEKQNQIIAALEDQLQQVSIPSQLSHSSKSSPINKAQSKSTKNRNRSPKNSPSKNLKFEKEIISILSKIPFNQDEIQSICNSNDSISEKIRRTVDNLTEYSYTNQNLQTTNQKLFSVICGQFKFIDNLTNSKKCFEALFPEASYEEYRSLLISQVGRIQNFISTYAKGLSEDSCLFDDLLKTQNSQDLLNNIKQYLDEYAKPQSVESEELFVLLLQAISCNDILRKYGDEARKYNTILSQRYKAMKDSSDRAKKALEVQSSSMIQESNSKIQDTIIAAKSILRKSIIVDQNQSSDLINYLEDLDNVAPVKDNEYIKSLQKQNGEFRKEISELKEENANLVCQTRADLELAQSKMKKFKDDLSKKLSQATERNKLLGSKLKQIWNSYQNLKKTNQSLQSNLKNAEEKNKQIESDYNLLISDTRDQLNSAKAEFENFKKETKEKSDSIIQTKNFELSQIKEKNQELFTALTSENADLKAEIKKEKKKNEELLAKCSEKENELKQNEMDALNAAEEISKKFSELHSDFQNLEIENRSLKSRLNSKSETVKREKAILESQMKAQIMSIQHDARKSVEAEKMAQCAKSQLFMNEICKFFPEYVNIKSPISEETVFDMLKKTKEKIGSIDKDNKNNQILNDMSKLLNVNDFSSIPSTLESLVLELRDQKEAIEQAEIAKSTLLHCTEWLKRIYSILTNGAIDNANCEMMKKTIEDALLASLGENSVFQRLETLKVEKILLLKKVQDTKTKKGEKPTLRQLMIVMMYIMRLKKISGHMDNNQYSFAIQFPKATESESENNFPESPFLNLTYQE